MVNNEYLDGCLSNKQKIDFPWFKDKINKNSKSCFVLVIKI